MIFSKIRKLQVIFQTIKKNESYKKENYHKKEYPLYLEYKKIESDKFFFGFKRIPYDLI